VTRFAAVVLLLAATARAESTVVFVDGHSMQVLDILSADPARAVLQLEEREWEVPTANLVAIRFSDQRDSGADNALFNLYLADGSRLHGTVSGVSDGKRHEFSLKSGGIESLRVPLERVRAVRFGRLLHGLQAKYDQVFSNELRRGRDAVVVQRDTRPFPIAARVLGVTAEHLTVLVGDSKRDLPLHKVYGFVRSQPTRSAMEGGIHARVHLEGGAHVTLPLERIGKDGWIRAGGAQIRRDRVRLIEFMGDHIAHVGDFDPIDVEETGLFGKAWPWRRDAMVLGGALKLDGDVHERGIGVHAHSRLEFVLGKRWRSFYVRCGIDDAAGHEGEAIFRILGDGKVLKEVRCSRRGKARARTVLLDVSDVDRLVLEAVPGESYTSDLCDWAEARVFNAAPIEYPDNKKE
jgi:hypothetical protein